MENTIKYALPVLIASGILHLYFFYFAFGIPIFSFLEIGEVLSAFLNNFLQNLILIALVIINRILIFGKKEDEWHNEVYDKLLISNTFLKRLGVYIKEFWPLITISISYVFAVLIAALIRKEETHSIIWLVLITIVTWIAGFYSWELPILYKKNNTSPETQKRKNFFSMILLLVLFIYFFTQIKINSIKYDNSTYGTQIYLDNNYVLISDSTNYYVGKTNNYIFIYHKINNYSEVYPIERVKKIVY